MFVFILAIAASSVGVQSQRCSTPAYIPCFEQCGPYEPATLANIATVVPVAVMPDTTMYLQPRIVPEIAVPVATIVETAVPVIPFITELPNCPDICFNDILTSPLGCLDPILTTYSTKSVCPLPNMPVSPLLPAASPVSSLAPPFSRLLPPVSECDCYSQYLKRVPIPPPFI